MKRNHLNFLNNLDIKNINILRSLLNEDLTEVKEYLDKRILNSGVENINALVLSKDIPTSYLPITGISLPSSLKSVYDVITVSDSDKANFYLFGPTKVANLNYSIGFLMKILTERIAFNKENGLNISSGKIILDEDLEKKKLLVKGDYSDILSYLLENGSLYVFSRTKTQPNLNCVSDKMKDKLIEILARYSNLEDLTSHNIDSFQKFIKK